MQLSDKNIGQEVRLSGWVETIRDHGGVIFLDLRDYCGKMQIVFNDDSMLESINRETVISVVGKLRARSDETINPNHITGYIEVFADKIEILGPCKNMLPFEISESKQTREDLRMMFRYLDLRNPVMRDNIILRANIIS
jgi:aspartyl-tRNA synthetase